MLRWALWIDIATSVIFLVISLGAAFSPALAKVAGTVSNIWLLIAVLSFILLLVWAFRVAANVHGLGGKVSFEPPWAVGWLIVPVANVWMAFVVIEEIWRASVDAHDWNTHHAPWLVVYWWGAWAAACILGALAYYTGALPVKIAYLAAHIMYAYLLGRVVTHVRDLQQAQASRMGFA